MDAFDELLRQATLETIDEQCGRFRYEVNLELSAESGELALDSTYVFAERPDVVALLKMKSQTGAEFRALYDQAPESVSISIIAIPLQDHTKSANSE